MRFVFFSTMTWRQAALLGLALILSACSSRRSLPALMVERLNWMDEVAMAKQVKSLPITDPVREAELLNSMTKRGVEAGLKPDSVRRFFTGQMLAAKVVQEEWLRQHPQGVTSSIKVPNLALTVRPALDEIGRQMIASLAQPRRSGESAAILKAAGKRLARAGYSEVASRPALEGLEAGLAP
jgi:chorismate mutase-like protein